MTSQKKTGLVVLMVVLAIIPTISSWDLQSSPAINLTGEEQLAIYESYLHKFPGAKVVVKDYKPEEFEEDMLRELLTEDGDAHWAENFPLGDRKYAIPYLQEPADLPEEAQDFYTLIEEAKRRSTEIDDLQSEFGSGARFVELSSIVRSRTRVGRNYFYCTEISGPLSASSGIVVVDLRDGKFHLVDALILWVS